MSDSARRTGGFLGRIRQVLNDNAGVGAIEFALIAPVLIVLYIGSAEISVAMSINKKVARAASTVADLVTRQDSVNKTYLKSMVDVANAIMSPYNESPVDMKITEIHIDSSKSATVGWSWDQNDGRPYISGNPVTVPPDLSKADTSLIRAELFFDHALYMPGAKSMNISELTMSKTYYLRPRTNDEIDCSNC